MGVVWEWYGSSMEMGVPLLVVPGISLDKLNSSPNDRRHWPLYYQPEQCTIFPGKSLRIAIRFSMKFDPPQNGSHLTKPEICQNPEKSDG